MQIVGAVEIAGGVLVEFKPKRGGYVVALWLVGIIVNLLLHGDYLDIALRDWVWRWARWRWPGWPISSNPTTPDGSIEKLGSTARAVDAPPG